MDAAALERAEASVLDAMVRWEPRVEVGDVAARDADLEGNTSVIVAGTGQPAGKTCVDIDIAFTERATATRAIAQFRCVLTNEPAMVVHLAAAGDPHDDEWRTRDDAASSSEGVVSLPFPNLDNRRFQDIVDEAKRLIPEYCPEWTNLEPSDPGVVLIELFAWMSEMLMFRLDQVPQAFYLRMLDLLGVQPFPPQAARLDVTFWLADGFTDHVTVPGGTEVSTSGDQPVVFATIEDLTIRQPKLITALTGTAEQRFVNVWDLLSVGDEVTLAGPEPAPGDGLYLGFADSLARSVLKLDVGASIEGLGVDPRNPPLAWEVWAGEWWEPARIHHDETGGLQRDGSIILLISGSHAPLTLAGKRGVLAPGPVRPNPHRSSRRSSRRRRSGQCTRQPPVGRCRPNMRRPSTPRCSASAMGAQISASPRVWRPSSPDARARSSAR